MVSIHLFSDLSYFKMKNFRGLWLLLFLLSFNLQAAVIQVVTDRDPVSLNESFQLTYESTDSVDDDPDFTVLKPHVDILNQSQSSNVSIVNGSYSSSKSWVLTVMAKKAGELNLPPVPFGSDQSMPLSLRVNKKSQQDASASEDFFTRLRVSSKQVYVQQQLIVTQSMYSSKNISAYSLSDLNFSGSDVVIEQLGDEKQYKTRIGNRAYLVIEKSYAIYPQVAGALDLKPVMAEARTASLSSSFFDPLGRKGGVVRAQSEAVSLAVLPIPLDADMSPWLPAESLVLEEKWAVNPPKFIQGEPLTRTISIKAEGLTAAQLPELPEISMSGVKLYPDQPLIKDIENDTGITGYRTEKVAFIPTGSGEVSLPEIEIPWWNTVTQQREVAKIPARIIQVSPALGDSSMPLGKPRPLSIQTPIEELKAIPGTMADEDNSFTSVEGGSTKWKWLSIIFALAWVMTMLAWIIFSRKRNNRPIINEGVELSSSRKIKQALTQLETSCNQRDSSGCRSALINWAELLFADAEIQGMKSIMLLVPQRMAEEIEKIDIGLYAESPEVQQRIIDFDVIAKEARKLSREQNKKPDNSQMPLLEPMYK